jgi:hypothetical protein
MANNHILNVSSLFIKKILAMDMLLAETKKEIQEFLDELGGEKEVETFTKEFLDIFEVFKFFFH